MDGLFFYKGGDYIWGQKMGLKLSWDGQPWNYVIFSEFLVLKFLFFFYNLIFF